MPCLDSLLPEMLGEIRQWLEDIDRVHLQRTCKRFHALDRVPVCLPSTWQRVWESIWEKAPSVVPVFQQLVAAGVLARMGPSVWGAYDVDSDAIFGGRPWPGLQLQWFQLPTETMQDLHPFECVHIDELLVFEVASDHPAPQREKRSFPWSCDYADAPDPLYVPTDLLYVYDDRLVDEPEIIDAFEQYIRDGGRDGRITCWTHRTKCIRVGRLNEKKRHSAWGPFERLATSDCVAVLRPGYSVYHGYIDLLLEAGLFNKSYLYGDSPYSSVWCSMK